MWGGAAAEPVQVAAQLAEDTPSYDSLVKEARECVGHGGLEGAFPEEWSAQLLLPCHDSHDGHKVVIFCPYFVLPVNEDADEMDRALRFVLMSMDDVIKHCEKYIFIYCFLGLDWSNPNITARMRFAYDHLPDVYREKLDKIYVLNKSWSFQATLWGCRMMLSSDVWNSITYVDGLDALCQLIHPEKEDERKELKRKFPFFVHLKDAEILGTQLEGAVSSGGMEGMPLETLSSLYGVDFFDRTTGKSYPRLPSPVIFLCEALERGGGETDFKMDEVSDEAKQKIIQVINRGEPLEQDGEPRLHWFALKHFLDSIPNPLLSFEAMGELSRVTWGPEDSAKQKEFLINLFKNLPEESAFLALYIASFLHTMLGNSLQRCGNTENEAVVLNLQVGKCLSKGADGKFREQGDETELLTMAMLSRAFTPVFLRASYRKTTLSKEGTEDANAKALQAKAAALFEALINYAEEPELWVGKPPSTDHFATFESSSSEDDRHRF